MIFLKTCVQPRPGSAARLLLAVLGLLCVLLPITTQAQDCSRNMLSLTKSGSYMVVRDAATLHLSGAFTIECWAKSTSSNPYAGLIEKADEGGETFYGIVFGVDPQFEGRYFPQAGAKLVTSPDIPNFNDWHHYAFSFTPGDSIRLFLDGEQVAAKRASVLETSWNPDSLRVGLSVANFHTSFSGAIDEVRIWNSARSKAEIKSALFTTVNAEPSLVAYYSFDDPEGVTQIHDFSSHNNDGYLRGTGGAIVPSTSPVIGTTSGFMVAAKQKEVDFGTLLCDTKSDKEIELRNLGRVAIKGTLGLWSGAAFSIASGNDFALPADSNTLHRIRIHFDAPQGGAFYDTLIAVSSTACGGVTKIPIRGRVVRTLAKLDFDTLDFGKRINCQLPATLSVRLRNLGDTTISLPPIILPATSGVEIASPTSTISIPVGQSAVISVRLMPSSDGLRDLKLDIPILPCNRSVSLVIRADRSSVTPDLPTIVDFGSITNTLNGVIRDTTLVIANHGSEPFLLTQSGFNAGSKFKLMLPLSNTYVAPGETETILVRLQVDKCGDFTGALKLQGLPCGVDTTVTFKVKIVPPTVDVNTPVVEIGRACWRRDTSITITNTSSTPVTITGSHSTLPGALFIGSSLFPKTLQPGAGLVVPLTFTPNRAGDYTVDAAIDVAPCGTVNFTLVGSAGVSDILFSDTLVDFGRGCDLAAVSKNFTVQNNSPKVITIGSLQTSGSSSLAVVGTNLPLALLPGNSRTFTVRFTPALGQRADTRFTFLTDEGCLIDEVHARGTRELPSYTLSNNALDFDTVCPGSSKSLAVMLHNTGSDTLDILATGIVGALDFKVSYYTEHIPPDSALPLALEFDPASTGGKSARAQFAIPSCGEIISIDLTGSGGPQAELRFSELSHDFGRVRVGDTSYACLSITNPSCVPLTFDKSTLPLKPPFYYNDSSLLSLPFTLRQGETHTLCFHYAPKTRARDDSVYRIKTGPSTTADFALMGQSISPELRLSDTVIDAGYVLIGSPRIPFALTLFNDGNDTANISRIRPQGVQSFSVMDNVTSIEPGGKAVVRVLFDPLTAGPDRGQLVVEWDGPTRSAELRGEGTSIGLLPDHVQLDFGDVRIGDSAGQTLHITALNGFANTLTSVQYSSVTDEKSFPDYVTLPATLASALDEIDIAFHFVPRSESVYSTTIELVNDKQPVTVTLTGRGVMSHLALRPDSIWYGSVSIDNPDFRTFHISNTGTAPLNVTAITSSHPEFEVVSTLPPPIMPGDGQDVEVRFDPKGTKPSVGTITIVSDAPELAHSVRVAGVGAYTVLNRPRVTYALPAVEVRSGDRFSIPVTMSGANLNRLPADSFSVRIAFDPHMLWVLGAQPATVHVTRELDSVVRVSGSVSAFGSNQILFTLDAEALLGPTRVSPIRIIEADPMVTGATTFADGSLTVTDCGDQPGGIVFRGDYDLRPSRPNPVRDNVTFNYKLGLAGDVLLDLYDMNGKLVRTLVRTFEEKGEHSRTVSVSDVPSGRYEYVLHSLEFTERGAMVVQH